MLARLTHAAIAFAVTAVAYQAYVLGLAPWIDPPVGVVQRTRPAASSAPHLAPDRYRELLAVYFPRDHWCLAHPPIAFENGQALVVVDGEQKYAQSDDGKLRVPRCVVVFFPGRRDRTAPPPRDAIILEPSGGAMLQMEERLDTGASSFGRMQFGQLLGAVTVRSDMRAAGPDDDLQIATRDLYMNEDLIQTAEPVEMRLGPHFGRGRGLEIRRLPADSAAGGDGSLVGRLESLEITHEVAVVVAAAAARRSEEKPDVGSPRQRASDAPIRIQSAGPFHIDFGSLVASFTEEVQVRQLHPDGKLDELTADRLNLYFDKAARWNGSETADADDTAGGSFVLEPQTIEAIGSELRPVRLKAPSQEAGATGEHLYIELADRRVTLEGGEQVTLTFRGAEVQAPMVQYQLPPANSPERVGVLYARGGFGRLTAVPDPERPDQVLEVTWKDSLQLVRDHGQPVLKLDGRPRVTMIGVGALYADRLELFLRDDGAPSSGGAFPSTVRPKRLTASDHVVIQSAELRGKVNRLDLQFDYPEPVAADGMPGNSQAAAGNVAAPLALGSPRPGAATRSYEVAGVELKLNVAMRDRRPAVTRIRVDGAATFEESPPTAAPAPGQAPLRISAERLEVAQADTPNAQIEILGAGGSNGLPFQAAEVSARGAVLRAPRITLNRGTGQAWVNSPGQIEMTVDRDATGAPLAQPQPVDVTWQESMRLEGAVLTFAGDVRVKNPQGWLRTRRLAVKLTAPVQFDGGAGREPPQVAALRCDDGAVAEFDQVDAAGTLTTHQRVELQWLQADQITGDITGSGPGRIDSVHLGRRNSNLLAAGPSLAGGSAPPPEPEDGEPQLHHLSVSFLREITGNIQAARIGVAGDVKTVYGPVDAWEQRLTMSPGGRPDKDVFWLTCDELQVARSPLAGWVVAADGTRKPANQVELLAQGHVVIEGQDPRGAVTMRGHRASYDQPKTQFVLEGDGQHMAVVTHQQYPGAPPSEQSFQKFFYYQNTGDVTIQGSGRINWVELNQTQKPGGSRK